MSNLKEVLRGLGYAAENSKRTQVATTGGTYQKARKMLDEAGVGDDVLDYGEGKRFVIEKAPLAATGAKVKRVRKKRK